MVSKAYPSETLRNHLIGVMNWILFLLRTRVAVPFSASGFPARQSGKTPCPIEMEDPWDVD